MKLFTNLSWQGIGARLIGVVFALFISIFAMDVFTEEQGFWKTAAALAIHLIPSFFILLIIFIAWKFEWVGAVVFTLLGVLYVFTRQADPLAYVLIAGPLLLAGILFGWSYLLQRKTSASLDMKW